MDAASHSSSVDSHAPATEGAARRNPAPGPEGTPALDGVRDADGPARHSRWLLPALLGLVLLIELPGFGWGLPHTVAPHVDDAAKPALTAMQQRFLGVTKYPKVHLLTLAAAYTPYLAWLWMRGDLQLGEAGAAGADSSAFRDPVGSLVVLLLIARGVSLALHLATVALVFLLLLRLTGNALVAAASGALYGLAPMLGLLARTSRVDVPMCFWLALAGWMAWRVLEQRGGRGLLAFALVAILAVCTKEQAAFLLAPLCVVVGVAALRSRRGRPLLGAVLAGLLLYALLNDLLWSPSTWWQRLSLWRADLGSFAGGVARHPGPLELLRQTLASFVDAGGVGLAALTALASLATLVAPERRGLTLLGLLLAYPALACSSLGFTQPRYLAPAVLVAVVLVGHQLAQGLAVARPTGRRALAALVALCLLASAAQSALVSWAYVVEPRGPAQALLAAHLAPGNPVEIYQNENRLPGIRALGLLPVRRRDFDQEAFLARAPHTVLVGANSRWDWDAAQRHFIEWLMEGPPGYRVTRFGPSVRPLPARWMPRSLVAPICPEYAVLERESH